MPVHKTLFHQLSNPLSFDTNSKEINEMTKFHNCYQQVSLGSDFLVS